MNVHGEFKVIGEKRPCAWPDKMIRFEITAAVVEIEQQFGPAVSDWSLRFIHFSDAAVAPCKYYPDGFEKTVGIRLVAQALEDVDIARYQLAHELVHCLAPTGESSALVVEEGAATRYQQGYSKKHLGGRVWLNNEKYKKALYLYNELAKQQCGAVKRLRQVEPCFSNWTHETFGLAGMSLDSKIERQLLTKFDEFKP